jgi:hypothetical protein
MSAGTSLDDDVRARINSGSVRRLEEIAHDRSEPGNKVTVSDLVREAIDEYLQRHSDEN